MFKLVIYVIPSPLTGSPPYEYRSGYEFDTSAEAELRALLYLHYAPDDIVMLLELEKGVCKHCDEPIEEKYDWVMHKWIHSAGGSYLCWGNNHTKAEPKEIPK